jgi:hypothetical protein
MQSLLFALALLGLMVPSAVFAQNATETGNLARTLSEVGGIPLGTAVTDLVTKGSTSAITSNLQQAPTVAASVRSLDQPVTSKGYIVRDVELDPRFEANVNRILNQISLEAVTPVSAPPQGITIPAAPSSQNSIQIFGQTISSQAMVRASRSVRIGPQAAADAGASTQAPQAGSNLRVSTPTADVSNERVWGGVAIPDSNDVFRDSVAIIGNGQLCSGVQAGGDWVVTAAHCFCNGVMDDVIVGTSVLSSDRVKVVKDQSKVFRPCEQIKADPGVGDIALLKLERPLAQPAKPLASLAMVKDSAAVRAVGFGRTATAVGFKYQVNVVIASYQCDGAVTVGLPDSQVYRCKPSHELVAAGFNRDTCSGDSGGGVYVFGMDTKVYLAAVTSRGVHPNGECGRGGIYTLLAASPIREWIEGAGISFSP